MQRKSMPRSCYTLLRYMEAAPNGLTHHDLVSGTGLAPRTVRYAVRRLKDEGLIVEKFNFRDARQTLYSIQPSAVPSVQTAVV